MRVGPQLCQTQVPDAASQSPARPFTLQLQNKPRKSLRMTLAEWDLPYHIVQVLPALFNLLCKHTYVLELLERLSLQASRNL